MSDITEIQKKISGLYHNPAAIQRVAYETLEKVGIDIVDASNAFIFLLEASAVNTSAAMVHAEALTRQQYPSMALTEEELYLHMSDRDYISRFSSPSRTTFTLYFDKEELMNVAVPSDVDGVKKLVIPRDTEFKVSEYTFTMQYPIELRILSHGGIQVVYDTTQTSPLQTLESNLVDWNLVKLDSTEYVRLKVPVNQFNITTYYGQINTGTKFSKTFNTEDQYYYCRAYKRRNDDWFEIKTTHTDQVFNPNDPTLVLTVFEKSLQVTVPQIYISNGLLDSEIRVDIYTTKGPLDLILDNYELNFFTANWRDIGNSNTSNKYSAPLNVFANMSVYSDSVVTGGTLGLTFSELRERVIMNALGNNQLPITNAQLTTQLSNLGYTSIRDVDNVTNRIYLASRRLPKPTSEKSISAAGCSISAVQGTFIDFESTSSSVINNGDRLTLTSNVLYERNNGVISIVPDALQSNMSSMTTTELILEVNSGKYLTSPFHYVLDANDNKFVSRAYYLDGPEILNRQFIEENISLELQITTDTINIYKEDYGYLVQLVINSGPVVKDIPDSDLIIQLSFLPKGEVRHVFLEGIVETIDDKRIVNFSIETKFDVTEDHHLLLSNFKMFIEESRDFSSDLNMEFNIVYYIKNYNPHPLIPNELVYNDGLSLIIESDVYAMTHEKLNIKFGSFLEGFWENSRSTIKPNIYKTYVGDVYAYYEKTVYERDSVTGRIVLELGSGGEIEYTILHNTGDPILDGEGAHVIKHHIGDPIIDSSTGESIIVAERDVLREVDVFLLDGRYSFATKESSISYVKEIPNIIIGWLEDDIAQFRQWALEQTEIYFYPQKTIGNAEVTTNEGEVISLEVEQSLTVKYFLTSDKYQDTFLRDVITETTVEVITDQLQRSRITISELISMLTARLGNDVIAMDISGLGGELNLPIITLNSEADRLSIRKKLEATLDGKLQVVDDVSIVFLKHEE